MNTQEADNRRPSQSGVSVAGGGTGLGPCHAALKRTPGDRHYGHQALP